MTKPVYEGHDPMILRRKLIPIIIVRTLSSKNDTRYQFASITCEVEHQDGPVSLTSVQNMCPLGEAILDFRSKCFSNYF